MTVTTRKPRRDKIDSSPEPESSNPASSPTDTYSRSQRLSQYVLYRILERIHHGSIEITDPGGKVRRFGKSGAMPAAQWIIHDPALFTEVLLTGEYGLGMGYARGAWDSPNVLDVCLVIVLNRTVLQGTHLLASIPRIAQRLWRRQKHRTDNSFSNMAKQIGRAYDVGNDFMSWMLGPTMQYTCAIYPSAEASLDVAQRNKMAILLKKAEIEPHHQVLELGCGFGTFAGFIREKTGASVRAVTLSRCQYEWAVAHNPGIHFENLDYREVDGTYERILSVGMSEHVGIANQPEFFRFISARLKPGGRYVLHSMVDLGDLSLRKYDLTFVHEIMPFGELPSLNWFHESSVHSGLRLVHQENFGIHYARTCADWRANIIRHRQEIVSAYSEEFYRGYLYLWCICGALMETTTSLVQMVFEKRPYGHSLEHSAVDSVR